MGFRILRICSEEENFKKRLSELKHQFLMPRNYKSKLIDDQFSRLRDLPGLDYKEKRKEALKKVKKEREKSDRIIPKLYQVKWTLTLKRSTHKEAPGWKKCAKPCKICPYTWENTQSITGTASKFNHEIKEAVTCDSSNCIYYWRCVKPNCPDFPKCEYLGKTTKKFKDSLAEHHDYPKRDMVTEPSGKHFTKPGHDVSHMRGLVLEQVRERDPYILKSRV